MADGEIDTLRCLPTPGARLSTAVAVAAIRWLGFIPVQLDDAPAAGIARLAGQFDGDPADLAAYAPAERTAREHRQRAAQIAHFSDVDDSDLARLEDLLVEHALEHDSPLALLRTATRDLRERQLLRPGVSTLERLIASARARAERETHERLSPLLDDNMRRALDALCVTDIALGVSRLVWLGREATLASPAQIVAQLEKLAFLRELGAAGWALEVVAANRRRQLAALARRSTTAALAGRPDRLRYPALLCFCGEQAVRLVDEVLDRADQAVGEAHGQALRELNELKTSTATAANEKVALFDLLVGLLLDDSVADDELRPRAWEARRQAAGRPAWAARRSAALATLGLPARADERLAQLAVDIDERVAALDRALTDGDVAVDVQDGELHVRRLPGAERPTATTELAREISARLPQVDLADVLIDVDAWTQFSDELTHAHGATPRQPRLREHRYAALLAHACNLGYARMGQAARIDQQQLAWITQWYLRPEALAAANARIVNAHHGLALAQEWGDGRFSSSDGKRYWMDPVC